MICTFDKYHFKWYFVFIFEKEGLLSKSACSALCFKNFGDSNIEILLVCESNNSSGQKDAFRWSLPGGKCCDSDLPDCCSETPEETVIRECKEETGYDVAVMKLASEEEKFSKETRTNFKKFVFLVEVVGGESLKKKVFAVETPKWTPLNKLPRNLFFSHRKIIGSFFLSLLANK